MKKHFQRYVDHLHGKPAHERRKFSLRVATGATIAIFAVWISTLGVRLAQTGTATVASGSESSLVAATQYADAPQNDSSQSAAAIQSQNYAEYQVPPPSSYDQNSVASTSEPDATGTPDSYSY